jgi:hypothetical protein
MFSSGRIGVDDEADHILICIANPSDPRTTSTCNFERKKKEKKPRISSSHASVFSAGSSRYYGILSTQYSWHQEKEELQVK